MNVQTINDIKKLNINFHSMLVENQLGTKNLNGIFYWPTVIETIIIVSTKYVI